MRPSVLSASKSGAVSPIVKLMSSPRCGPGAGPVNPIRQFLSRIVVCVTQRSVLGRSSESGWHPERGIRETPRSPAIERTPHMQLGMVGLGRMGANMVRRLQRGGHDCVAFDRHPENVQAVVAEDATDASSLEELVAKLDKPRSVWLMIPAAYVDATLDDLLPLLETDDVVIDGGNSFYQDDLKRSARLGELGMHYVDCGTSGGVWGLERGYSLMIGGDGAAVGRLEPIFATLAPGVEAAPRTPGREGDLAPGEAGWLHCGPPGAGHFVKMVHNGIEYGLMAAYAEGLNILKNANAGSRTAEIDAETAPLAHPEHYRYDIDVAAATEVWRRGSVIASWLLDLTAQALAQSPELDGYAGRVSDSGEGRWTAIAAIEEGVPAPVLTTALYSRFASRDLDSFANKAMSAMRSEFGGHDEKAKTQG